jgi:hypothetical protein
MKEAFLFGMLLSFKKSWKYDKPANLAKNG